MSGMWKRSHGSSIATPPDERGGNSCDGPTATAPHLDSTLLKGGCCRTLSDDNSCSSAWHLVISFVVRSFERFVSRDHRPPPSRLGCMGRLGQLIGKPQLYERLASHAQPPRFTVEGF